MAVRLSSLSVGRPLPPGRFLVLISARGWFHNSSNCYRQTRNSFISNYYYYYCGVPPKSRIIERPLIANGYTSRSGFIGNAYKSTQQPTSEYWKHIGGSFPRKRVSTDKFPAQQIGRFMTTNYPTCLLVSPRRAYFTGSNVGQRREPVWRRDRIPPP
jgi:hypothetical protein